MDDVSSHTDTVHIGRPLVSVSHAIATHVSIAEAEVGLQGYCVLDGLVTALIKSLGRRLARLVAWAMLGSPLLRW